MIPTRYIDEMRVLKTDYHYGFRYAYFRDYVMVPFIDSEDGRAYYFHSRKFRNLENSMANYLACPYRPRSLKIDFFLNEKRIDKSKPVIIAEGTMDALNLPNSIAVNGIHKISEEQTKEFEREMGEDIIYALDNEMMDADAKNKIQILLKQQKKVFLWKLFSKDFPQVSQIKDFNKLCCKAQREEVPLSIIQKYSTNNPTALLKE